MSSRSAAAFFGAFLCIAIISSFVVFALRADGREGTESTTNDGGAWLVNQRTGSIGHVNRNVEELSAAVRVSQPTADFDVYQPHGVVVAHDRTSGTLEVIDERVHTRVNTVEVPDDATIMRHDNGLVIQSAATQQIWNVPSTSLNDIGSVAGLPPIFAGDLDAVGVRPDGAVFVATPDGQLQRIDGDVATPIMGAERFGPVQAFLFDGTRTLVRTADRLATIDDDRLVILDTEVDAWSEVGISSTDTTGSVVAATSDGRVVRIDSRTGATRSLGNLGGAAPAPPLEHQGCVYALTNDPPQFWVSCGNGEPRITSLSTLERADLRLRLVNDWVWINDVTSGSFWLVDAEDELSRIDDWGSVLPNETNEDASELPSSETDTEIVEDVENPDADDAELIDADEFDEDGINQPPVAVDDLDVRTPEGRPAIIDVLGNDTDPDNDVLLISSVENGSGLDAVVVASADGRRIQVTPAPGFLGTLRYSYTITDGRGGSDTAIGTVVVERRTGESNQPPIAVTDVAAITAGDRLVLNVLSNDSDPDGDSLVLVDAATDEGTISFDPSGQVVFEPSTTSDEGEVLITYVVSDDFGERVEGTARVSVRLAESNQPPDARNDGATTVAGQPITIALLANDTDPDGDELFVAQRPTLLSPEGADIFTTISPDGEFVVIAEDPGTYIFSYAASDDEDSDLAQIRIEVIEPVGNQPPVALRDDIVIPLGESRIVYVLANDSDPDGDIVGIVDVAVPPGTGLRVEPFLDQGFRVFVDEGPARRTFSYTISDGKSEPVQTTVVVAVAEPTGQDNPPIAEPDTVEVRAGVTVTVPVLDNDFDPEGEALTVVAVSSPELGSASVGPLGQSVRLSVDATTRTSFTLSYDVVDPGGNRTSTVIRVRIVPADEPNRPPIARPDAAWTPFGQTLTIDVDANDDDPDGDTIQIESITEQPRSGTATIDLATGTVIYEPAIGFSGTDRFRYSIVDALGARATGEVLVGVMDLERENREPQAVDDSYLTIATGQRIELDLLRNDVDPDGDQLRISSVGDVSTGELVDEAGVLFYAAPTNQADDVTVTFEYSISDSQGGSASATVSILVQATPEIPEGVTLAPIANLDIVDPVRSGDTVRVEVLANDVDPDTPIEDLIVELGDSLAAALLDASVDGQTIVFTATESTTLTYVIIDPDGNRATGSIVVTVIEPVPPLAIDDVVGPTTAGEVVVVDVLVNDTDPDGVPTDLEIASVSGDASVQDGTVVIVAPDETAQFTYTIRDLDGLEASATITVLVAPNLAPTIEPVAVTTDFETPIEIDLAPAATDPDGDPLLFACCQSASNGAPLVLNAGENQLLVEFTPDDGFSGDAVFTFQVDDGFGHQVAGTATVTVGEQPNRPPEATDASLTLQAPRLDGPPVTTSIDLANLSSDPDTDDELTWSISAEPGNNLSVTLDGSTATVEARDDATPGTTSFGYTVTDPEQLTATATIDLTIDEPQNTPPSASDDSVTIPAGTTVGIDLSNLTSDPDSNELLSYEIDAGTPTGTTSTLTTRTTVTVAASINEVGTTDQLNYEVIDRMGERAAGVITLTVGDPEQPPPTTTNDTASVLHGDTVDIDVLGNDTDPIGLGLTITDAGGTIGTAEVVGNIVRYTPDGVFVGSTTVSYTITDITGAANRTATGIITIDVAGPPDAPAPPTCAPTSTQATITWTAPNANGSPITGYDVEAQESPGSRNVITLTDITGTSTDVTGLINGTAYDFRVRATNDAGQSDWSASSSPCTPDIAPERPAAPSVTTGDGWLELTWVPPVNDGSPITEYEVRIGGGTVQTTSDTTLRWTGLENGTEYTFQVAARNAAGLSPFSPASTPRAPSTIPEAPTIGTTTRSGLVGATASGILEVNWSALSTGQDGGATVTEYRVERRDGSSVLVSGANASSYVWSGLANGVNHEFRVYARNVNGEGPPSAWSAPLAACTIPSGPTNVTATAGDGQADVGFAAPADDGGCAITGYRIQIQGETSNSATPTAPGTVTITNLTNGTPYAFEVQAVNALGAGPWITSNAATPAGQPICGEQFTLGVINHDGASVFWWSADANGGANLRYETNTNGAGWVAPGEFPVGSTGSWSATIPSQTPNTNHTVTLRATTDVGSTTCSSISFISCPASPPAPGTPDISATIESRMITVTWNEVDIPCLSQPTAHTDPVVRRYEVDRDPGATEDVGLVTAKSWWGLPPGTTERARVRACDLLSCGAWSPWSDTVSIPSTKTVILDFDPTFPAHSSVPSNTQRSQYAVSTTESQSTIIGFPDNSGRIEIGLNIFQLFVIMWDPTYDCPGYRFDSVNTDGTYTPATAIFSCF